MQLASCKLQQNILAYICHKSGKEAESGRGFLPVNQTAVNINKRIMDADMLDLCAIGVVTAAALISNAEKNDGKQGESDQYVYAHFFNVEANLGLQRWYVNYP